MKENNNNKIKNWGKNILMILGALFLLLFVFACSTTDFSRDEIIREAPEGIRERAEQAKEDARGTGADLETPSISVQQETKVEPTAVYTDEAIPTRTARIEEKAVRDTMRKVAEMSCEQAVSENFYDEYHNFIDRDDIPEHCKCVIERIVESGCEDLQCEDFVEKFATNTILCITSGN